MIHVIRADERHFTDFGWLKTYWLFSFSEYYDPANIQFGALRVCNDDVVAPHTGFGTHPHKEMEISTVVLDGAVTHEDSLGTKAVIRAGDMQRMSAGTGIRHSECNLGEGPAHFYQIWIYPDTRGLPPSYDQKSFADTVWTNRLVPVASGQGLPEVVTFHTDATLYLGSLEAHRSVTHANNGTRRVFVYLTEGELAVDGARLKTKDQGRIDAEAPLTLTAHQDTRFVLIDVPLVPGLGVRSSDFTERTGLGAARPRMAYRHSPQGQPTHLYRASVPAVAVSCGVAGLGSGTCWYMDVGEGDIHHDDTEPPRPAAMGPCRADRDHRAG